MNAVEIEEAITALAEQPFDASEFPYAFLEVFGNERQRVHPLTEHCRQRMQTTGLAAPVGRALRDPAGKSRHPVGLPQQHRGAVRGHGAVGKRGFQKATLAAWKANGSQITIRHECCPSISVQLPDSYRKTGCPARLLMQYSG